MIHIWIYFFRNLYDMNIIKKESKEILSDNVTSFGLSIKKTPAIETVNEGFRIKWHSILNIAEKKLKELLIFASEAIRS